MVKNHLTAEGITFEERDITKNPDFIQEIKDLGFNSVPVTVSARMEPILDFQPTLLDKLK